MRLYRAGGLERQEGQEGQEGVTVFVDNNTEYVYIVVIMADVLGVFEQAVLLALLRLRREAYGRAILKDVHARLERDVAAGAVYATLERLEKKKLVTSHLGEGTPVRGGKARRYYRIEPTGLRALSESKAAHEALWRGVALPLGARA